MKIIHFTVAELANLTEKYTDTVLSLDLTARETTAEEKQILQKVLSKMLYDMRMKSYTYEVTLVMNLSYAKVLFRNSHNIDIAKTLKTKLALILDDFDIDF